MGIHFGGHKDKEKLGKEAVARQGRQSMDQQRTASFTQSPVRNSMSDGARPARFQANSNQGNAASSSLTGNRVVSQPSFPSPVAGRPGGNDVARPDYQERERAVSLTTAPSPSINASFQGPMGRSNSPRAESGSGQREGRGMSESTSQRENMQVGTFAVARRSSPSIETNPPNPNLQPSHPSQSTQKTHQQPSQPAQYSPTGAEPRSTRTSSSSRSGNPALAQVLQSYIDLNTIQANKLYASSPPELEMIFARQTNGAQPKYVPPSPGYLYEVC